MNADQIRDLVRSHYGAIAAGMGSSCCSPKPAALSSCCGGASDRPDAGEKARRMGYDETDLAATPCRGFTERLDTSTTIAPGVATKDAQVTVLADSLSVEPKANQTVIAEGFPRNIKNVGRDPAGAAWVLLAGG